jgi:hypothetical protein
LFTTCAVHPACQVETSDGAAIHHAAQPQPHSPVAPEGQPPPVVVVVAPSRWRAWRIRKEQEKARKKRIKAQKKAR